MKKNILKGFFSCLALTGAVVGLASCSSNADSDPNVLKVVCLDASYGTKWINTLKESFEKSHEGITVEINALYNAQSVIDSHLASSKNTDDLYISVGASWATQAISKKFASLDDLLDESVDGVKIKNKISAEYQDSIYVTVDDTSSCYRLPWTSGIGGIYYNAKMFKDHNWEIPTTYEELIALCETISNANVAVGNDGMQAVKPFAYTGANTDYFDYLVYDWWGQIVGTEKIDEFLKYEQASNFNTSTNPTYNALKTATSYWSNIFTNDKYVISGSTSKTAEAAQKEFANGYAAMIVDGDWLYNDLIGYTSSGSFTDSFELQLMKTPEIKEAVYEDISYVIGEDQYIAIPASSQNQDLAKEFIKLIVSDEGCKTFASQANGFLAYKCDYSSLESTNPYISSTIALRNSYTSTFTNFSDNPIHLANYCDIWTSAANRPYLALLNKTDNIDSLFAKISSYATNNWQFWQESSR